LDPLEVRSIAGGTNHKLPTIARGEAPGFNEASIIGLEANDVTRIICSILHSLWQLGGWLVKLTIDLMRKGDAVGPFIIGPLWFLRRHRGSGGFTMHSL